MPENLSSQYDKIYRYCYLHVHSRAAAEDLTQETFLRFLEHPEYQGKGYTLQYLYIIARNLCIDTYRKRIPEPLPEELAEECDTENEWVTHLTLEHAVAALTDEERELVLLRYVNEVPISVLCRLYHISRFALNRKLRKILNVLRSELEEEGTE